MPESSNPAMPLLAGKVLLLVTGAFVIVRLLSARKERKENRRNESLEKENMDRMRRAREEAQRKLEELGEDRRGSAG